MIETEILNDMKGFVLDYFTMYYIIKQEEYKFRKAHKLEVRKSKLSTL